MINLNFIGNIGKDAEQTSKPNWTNDVVNFSVAVSVGYGQSEKTIWVNVSKWVKSDSNLCQHLKKGTKVYISGIPSVRAYQNNMGESVGVLDVDAHVVEILSSKQ